MTEITDLIEVATQGKELTPFRLDEVEKKMLAHPQDVDCPVSHHFADGLYIRELRMPAGIIAMGHRQKFPHMNSFVKGKVLMLNEDGTIRLLEAPMTFVSPPGRKVGYIVEDVVWQNIYPTTETDVEVLEETYLDKSAFSIECYKRAELTQYGEIEAIRADYLKVLEEHGITHEQARSETENEADQMPMPYGWHKTNVLNSEIEGKGFFASGSFNAGDVIAPGRIGDKRTPAGRYTNHSLNPNAAFVKAQNGDIILVALKDISGCKCGGRGEEITVDYRQALRFRGADTARIEEGICQA